MSRKVYCGYKFRIYPNKKQQELIALNLSSALAVNNFFYDDRIEAHSETGKYPVNRDRQRELKILTDSCPELLKADRAALDFELKKLNTAFSRYIMQLSDFPKKKTEYSCTKYTTKGEQLRIIDRKHIALPMLGTVRCAVSREVTARIFNATVSRMPSGTYYVSLLCERNVTELPKTGMDVGIDMGIRNLMTFSNGETAPNPKPMEREKNRLVKLRLELREKEHGSVAYRKTRKKLARLYERMANQRIDNIHKLTTNIVRMYDAVYTEDLAVNQMRHRSGFALEISDAAWAEAERELEYKCSWYGRNLTRVGQYFPSSQRCSNCGYVSRELSDCTIRSWVCPQCGKEHDRDTNAAVNILIEGRRISKTG